jgi:hypothetical protein
LLLAKRARLLLDISRFLLSCSSQHENFHICLLAAAGLVRLVYVLIGSDWSSCAFTSASIASLQIRKTPSASISSKKTQQVLKQLCNH